MKPLQLIIAALVLAVTSACASATAKGKSKDAPPLNVPPAPARIIEPGPEPLPEPVGELPTTPASPSTGAPKSNRSREPVRPPEPKPNEPKPVEPAATPEPAPVTAPPAQPPAQLRTPQTADTSNAAKTVRTTIDKASELLNGIDYRVLSNVRKKAYDDAKRFIQQAEQGLKEGNLVFAQAVAVKAETLARELSGR